MKEKNYTEIYKTFYKRLPMISFVISIVCLGLIAIYDMIESFKISELIYLGLLSFIVGYEKGSSIVLAIFLWIVIIAVVSFFVRIFVEIIISQKIVLTDAILEIKSNTAPNPSTSEKADE